MFLGSDDEVDDLKLEIINQYTCNHVFASVEKGKYLR